jgi:hypothetical protein
MQVPLTAFTDYEVLIEVAADGEEGGAAGGGFWPFVGGKQR